MKFPYPLPMPDLEFQQRLTRVQEAMKEKGLDGLIVVSAYMDKQGDVAYLTNHRVVLPPWAFDSEHRGIGYCACVVPRSGGIFLASGPTLEKGLSRPQCKRLRSAPICPGPFKGGYLPYTSLKPRSGLPDPTFSP